MAGSEDKMHQLEKSVAGVPCPECGKLFGPDFSDMVVPQQLVPCGHSICATCIQGWKDKCEDQHAPVACPVCSSPVRDVIPNHLFCRLIDDLMRAELTYGQHAAVLLSMYKQHAMTLVQLIARDVRLPDEILALRSVAQEQKDRADTLEVEVIELRRLTEAMEAMSMGRESDDDDDDDDGSNEKREEDDAQK